MSTANISNWTTGPNVVYKQVITVLKSLALTKELVLFYTRRPIYRFLESIIIEKKLSQIKIVPLWMAIVLNLIVSQ